MCYRRETTDSERLLVVKWSKEGKSLREIASLIGVTHGCDQKILPKNKKTGSVWPIFLEEDDNMEKSASKLGLGSGFIFQQDNDPKHTAKIVQLYLLYHCRKQLHTPDLNVMGKFVVAIRESCTWTRNHKQGSSQEGSERRMG
ncbi:hypothetical protein TNCV_166371 [Trichonephila clavipes]|nr:hypothetical protein TNCV_166371 [Trichonephila clavipes]